MKLQVLFHTVLFYVQIGLVMTAYLTDEGYVAFYCSDALALINGLEPMLREPDFHPHVVR